jgi:hypothetical protein
MPRMQRDGYFYCQMLNRIMYRPIQITLFVLVLCSLLGSSCHKSSDAPASGLVGRWELSSENGGFAGSINYSPGNGNILQFNPSGSFTQFYSTGPSHAGTYELVRPGAFVKDQILLLNYNGFAPAERDSVRVTAGQLIFLPQASCCDIPTTTYLRIN